MKNLFDFATSELSQDAFLLWLFASWEDPAIQKEGIVHSLLEKFCELKKDDTIKKIKPTAQWKHCDIRLDIETEKKPKIILLIEDKTFSSEHSNQLENYKKAIEKESGEKHIVFYKTSKIDEKERERVDAAKWKPYDLEKILNIFRPFQNSSVFLVKQYYEHLDELEKCNLNTTKPERSETRKDLQKWIGYFKNAVINDIKIEEYDCYAYSSSNHYGYAYLIAVRNHAKGKNVPYLEIRSRDCLKGNFRALVLGYGIDESVLKTMVPILTKKAKQSDFWKTKYQRHKPNKEPKQICFYEKKLPSNADNASFVSCVETCIKEYKDLVDDLDRF